jgi:hypothetical protein
MSNKLITDLPEVTELKSTDVTIAVTGGVTSKIQGSNLATTIVTPLMGAANGLATLDDKKLVPTSQIPAMYINNVYVVTSEAEMLALAANVGDAAVRSDIETTFILKTLPASTLSNWIELLEKDAVQSVNSLVGAVSLGATAPLGWDSKTSAYTITQADTKTDGYVSSTDWNTFNGKEPALTKGNLSEATSSVLTISSGTSAVLGSGTTIEVKQADSKTSGYLSFTDWATFNGKEPALTKGELKESTSSVLTISNGTTAVIGSGTTIQVAQADSKTDGYITKEDFSTFNTAAGGTFNNILLPTASATVGQIKWNNVAYVHTYGTDNIFFGAGAGNYTLSGTGNSAYGQNSLHALTSGTYNAMCGYHAGQGLTSGGQNSVLGSSGLANLIEGIYNIAIGYAAGLGYTTTESSNILLNHGGTTGESHVIRIGTQGSGGGEQNKFFAAGIYNTTSGSTSQYLVYVDSNGQLQSSTTANAAVFSLPTTSSTVGQIKINNVTVFHTYGAASSSNLFLGANSGNYTLTTGSAIYNNSVGGGTLIALTSGGYNSAFSEYALNKVTTGSYNDAYGYYALSNLVGGSYNRAFGSNAGFNYTGSESSNIVIGHQGVTAESNILRIGTQGTGNGQQNKAFIAGIYNTTSGSTSKYIVYIDSSHQLQSSDTASPNLINLPTTTSTVGQIKWNTVTLMHTYGSDNIFIGRTAGNYTTTGGGGNVCVGLSTGTLLGTGYGNVFVGASAATKVSNGYRNVAIGNGALANATTGNNNIALGYNASGNYTSSEDSNIVIGNAGVLAESHKIRIGTTGTGDGQQDECYLAGVVFPATSIKFPTSGGTATGLAHYEETTLATTFANSSLTTGTVDFKLTRIGNIVTLTQTTGDATTSNYTANGAGTFLSNTALAARFRPANGITMGMIVYNGAYATGAVTIRTDGGVAIRLADLAANFGASGQIGWFGWSISWAV